MDARYDRYRLQEVVWELTLRCNMACHHCGSNALDPRPDELTDDQVLDVARQLASVPVRNVGLSGGEALLHPKWPAIVRILTDAGTAVSIITNGISIHDPATLGEILALQREGRSLTVSISLDGLRDTHNAIRGIDVFDRAVEGVRLLRSHGVYAMIQTTANRKNLADMPALRDFVFGELRPSGWQMQVLEGYGRAGSAREWLLTLEEFKWLFGFWEDTRRRADAEPPKERIVVTCTNCMGYYSETSPFHGEWEGCGAGIRALGIDSNGSVRGCLSLKHDSFIEGSLKERSLAELWLREKSFRYNREFTSDDLHGFCAECEYGPQCRGGCTSMAHSILGNPWEQPYCAWLEYLLRLDDNLVRIGAFQPEDRPSHEERWANPADDVVRLRKKNRENETARAAGQKEKEESIYRAFELRSKARARSEDRRAE